MSALVPLGGSALSVAGIPGSVINLFDQTYWSRGHRQSKKCWLIQSSSRLRLHGIVPNAGGPGQVVPGGLLTLFPVISGTRSPASAGGRNRLAGNHRPLHRLERVVDPVIQATILEL